MSVRAVACCSLALFALSALAGCADARTAHRPATEVAADSYLRSLVGEWDIERSIRGKIVANRMTATPVLGGAFVELHMESTTAGEPYEAIVLVGFDAAERRYVAHWCDSFGPGYSAVGKGTRDGQRLELVFDYLSGPFFNTWVFDPAADGWTFTGESGSPDGSRSLFARDVVRRRAGH